MSTNAQILAKLSEITNRLNEMESEAKTTDDFLPQYTMDANSKVRVYLNGESKSITIQQILDSFQPDSADNPTENRYTDISAMLVDQGNQTIGYNQYVADASDDLNVNSGDGVYSYLGTTNGDLTDYRRLTDAEISIITNTNAYRVFKVSDIQESYGSTPIADGDIQIEYNDATGKVTRLYFNEVYSKYLAKFNILKNDLDFHIQLANKSADKTHIAKLTGFSTILSGTYYVCDVANTIDVSELNIGDSMEAFISESSDTDGFGDMLASTYDPDGKETNAFETDNMEIPTTQVVDFLSTDKLQMWDDVDAPVIINKADFLAVLRDYFDTVYNHPALTGIWQLNTNAGSTPSYAQVTSDTGDPATSTYIRFYRADATGTDYKAVLMNQSVGSIIVGQQQANSDNYARYEVSGAPVDNSAYVEIPVNFISQGGTTASWQNIIFVMSLNGEAEPTITDEKIKGSVYYDDDASGTLELAFDDFTVWDLIATGTLTFTNGEFSEPNKAQVKTIYLTGEDFTPPANWIEDTASEVYDGSAINRITLDLINTVADGFYVRYSINNGTGNSGGAVVQDELEDHGAVSGTVDIDWAKATHYIEQTGAITLTESSLPTTGLTGTITIHVDANADSFSVVSGWENHVTGEFKSNDFNTLVVEFIKTGLYKLQISQ